MKPIKKKPALGYMEMIDHATSTLTVKENA